MNDSTVYLLSLRPPLGDVPVPEPVLGREPLPGRPSSNWSTPARAREAADSDPEPGLPAPDPGLGEPNGRGDVSVLPSRELIESLGVLLLELSLRGVALGV